MPWAVVTLNAVVDGEIAALPADMRARLVRLTGLIEQIGFEALPRDAVKHLRKTVGASDNRPRRHFARDLRHGKRPTRGYPARLRQEDAEDAAA